MMPTPNKFGFTRIVLLLHWQTIVCMYRGGPLWIAHGIGCSTGPAGIRPIKCGSIVPTPRYHRYRVTQADPYSRTNALSEPTLLWAAKGDLIPHVTPGPLTIVSWPSYIAQNMSFTFCNTFHCILGYLLTLWLIRSSPMHISSCQSLLLSSCWQWNNKSSFGNVL